MPDLTDAEIDSALASLAGLFGTRSLTASQAGQTTSPAKSRAARTNGAKGFRPRETA